MQWLKKLRKFGSITSTYQKSPILFCRYLGYLKPYRNGSVFKICVWISVFSRKKWLVNPLHGLQFTAILVTQENSGVFFETPCMLVPVDRLTTPHWYTATCDNNYFVNKYRAFQKKRLNSPASRELL